MPIATCTIEGDGEPEDRIMFHTEEDLLVFGARGDALPLVRIEGRGRNTLHGLWTDGSVQPTFLDTCALCTRISRH